MTSPTFVAQFKDGVVTRMTTHHSPNHKSFDLARGVALSRLAYKSRTKNKPPAILEAHFENANGTVLQTYTAAELGKMS
jgi:hypothetical protein